MITDEARANLFGDFMRAAMLTDEQIAEYAEIIPADFSTGCAKCDSDQRSRVITYIGQKLLREGEVCKTGRIRPCSKCGKPLPVVVHYKHYDPYKTVH